MPTLPNSAATRPTPTESSSDLDAEHAYIDQGRADEFEASDRDDQIELDVA